MAEASDLEDRTISEILLLVTKQYRHKDSEDLELTRSEKKIAEKCGRRVEKLRERHDSVRSAS